MARVHNEVRVSFANYPMKWLRREVLPKDELADIATALSAAWVSCGRPSVEELPIAWDAMVDEVIARCHPFVRWEATEEPCGAFWVRWPRG